MVGRGTIEVAKTVIEMADVALTAVECCHKYNHPDKHHDSQIDNTTPSKEEKLESLRSENRCLKNLLEENLKLLQNLSESASLLPECPPDLHARLMASVDSTNFLNQLKFLQQKSVDGDGCQFPFKEASEADLQTAEILINMSLEEPSWWVWVSADMVPSNIEERSTIDNENYVIISEESVVDGVANFMAKCVLSNSNAQKLTPEELQKTLTKGRVEQTGIDAIEINFSCPHGMPERKMGAAVGQDCELLEEVCGWINAKATVPVWAKMTPNITDITQPARVALKSGCEGLSAINTIMSVMGINLNTLHPEPCVEGYSTPGGYSAKAVHPIALEKVMTIAQMMKSEFRDKEYSLSAIGGVETGGDAAEFILLGANTVQVCTGVMVHGYDIVGKLCSELKDFMRMHNFSSVEDFRGISLQYFTTHMDLVKRQKEAIQKKKALKKGLQSDKDWTGDGFVKESESMVSN